MLTNQTQATPPGKEEHGSQESTFFLPGFLSIKFIGDSRLPNLNFPTNVPTVLFMAFCLLFELMVNLMVLLWVKMKDRVLVDTMVTTDCIANLLCILIVMLAFPVRVYRNKMLCAGMTFFRGITVIIKR